MDSLSPYPGHGIATAETGQRPDVADQPPRPGTPGFALWKRFTGLNTTVFRLSGGRLLGTYDGNPVLLLHHVGRRSGEERTTPLLYLRDGEDLVIVGSMGGTFLGFGMILLASP